jgi:N-acetylmuramic acid 6-phosphate etherase
MFCLAFTRAGGVHDGLMVDMVAGNVKLRERARHIVMSLTGTSAERAGEALAAANWHVKTAALMLKGAGTAVSAKTLLDAAQGNLREAMARLRGAC